MATPLDIPSELSEGQAEVYAAWRRAGRIDADHPFYDILVEEATQAEIRYHERLEARRERERSEAEARAHAEEQAQDSARLESPCCPPRSRGRGEAAASAVRTSSAEAGDSYNDCHRRPHCQKGGQWSALETATSMKGVVQGIVQQRLRLARAGV